VNDIQRELMRGLDELTPGRRAYLRRAYGALPRLDRPHILDVGCGRGGPTLELAVLSGGEVTGVDIDTVALVELAARAAAAGLTERVHVRECSMTALDFAPGAFDVVWAEGSAHVMGFEQCLDSWRRFIRPDGCLVIHESVWLRANPPADVMSRWRHIFPGIRTVSEYVDEIPEHGYTPLTAFALPEDFWWEDCYRPLVARTAALREKYGQDPDALAILQRQEAETDSYQRSWPWFGSAYFVMQRV